MPTTKPRYTLTDSGALSELLDAYPRDPELSRLVKAVDVGFGLIRIARVECRVGITWALDRYARDPGPLRQDFSVRHRRACRSCVLLTHARGQPCGRDPIAAPAPRLPALRDAVAFEVAGLLLVVALVAAHSIAQRREDAG